MRAARVEEICPDLPYSHSNADHSPSSVPNSVMAAACSRLYLSNIDMEAMVVDDLASSSESDIADTRDNGIFGDDCILLDSDSGTTSDTPQVTEATTAAPEVEVLWT